MMSSSQHNSMPPPSGLVHDFCVRAFFVRHPEPARISGGVRDLLPTALSFFASFF
jgi:hypothetical protein